jgi:hypothetical protein
MGKTRSEKLNQTPRAGKEKLLGKRDIPSNIIVLSSFIKLS